MKSRAAQAGFSLLEVLVAFAVLALTLGVLMQIFAGGSRNALNGSSYSRAVELAESVLALAGTESSLQPGVLQGEQAGMQWQLEILEYPMEDFITPPGNLQSYLVSARVSWSDGIKNRDLVLDSLRLAEVRR